MCAGGGGKYEFFKSLHPVIISYSIRTDKTKCCDVLDQSK